MHAQSAAVATPLANTIRHLGDGVGQFRVRSGRLWLVTKSEWGDEAWFDMLGLIQSAQEQWPQLIDESEGEYDNGDAAHPVKY